MRIMRILANPFPARSGARSRLFGRVVVALDGLNKCPKFFWAIPRKGSFMNRLQKLIELRAAKLAEIEADKEARKAITDAVEARGDADLTEEESVDYRAKTSAIAEKQDVVDDLSEQIRELEKEEERAGRHNVEVQAVLKTTTRTEVNEPLTYEKGNGQSYFRDLAKISVGMADEGVRERLQRHSTDVDTNKELRKAAKVGAEYRNLDRNDGTGGYAVPPLWQMQRFIELARSGRAYANLVPTEALPAGTDSINIPKIATGTSTSIQTADNATLGDGSSPTAHETDLTDTTVNAQVKTIAGQQGIAIQLLDQSPVAFDELVFRDLAADYATKLDLQVISGSGGGNQVRGVRNTVGITTITATSGSDNVKLIHAKIADAIQRVHTSRFAEPEVIVMHPRRWAFFLAAVDTTGRPLVVPSAPGENQIGNFGGVVSQRVVGSMHGLPVVTDPNLPTTLNTDQDVIHVLRVSDLLLFESSIRTRALQETRAEGLTVLLQVYGYLAFTAARFPQSVVEIGGTALATPTFS